jgi:hypothetical protein
VLSRCLLVLGLALLVGVGCRDRQDLEGDTVRVSYPDRRIELEVVSCGLDDGVFVLGASSADAFVQLLLVVAGDEVDRAASGLTVESAQDGVDAAGSARLLQLEPGVPGEITEATIRGDRVDVEADVRPTDAGPSGSTTPIEVAARCPEVEEMA